MKQKTIFNNFENIGYLSMNSQYISIDIGLKKAISVDL